jgi:murein tripeptide amidase MpaA
MFKKALIASTVLALLIAPNIASADNAAEPPGQGAPDTLELYVFDTTAAVEAALRADGYDVVGSTREGETVHLEVVMSQAEVAKANAKHDLALAVKGSEPVVAAASRSFQVADNGYEVWRTWSEEGGLRDEMEFLADEYGDLTELVTIGQTLQGQDIYAMKVTGPQTRSKWQPKRPAVLYIANQHAREWITPEVNRRLLHYYLENYGSDDRITEIVDSTELWFVLSANPDGYDYSFTEGNRLWRKNLRDNNGDGQLTTIDGVDLNRNFATNWGYDNEGSTDNPTGQTYRGTGPQSEPETQAMDALMASVKPAFMMNYHSAAELILYGNGWQVDTPTPDDLANIALAGDDANPAIAGYDPDLSAELYITNGDTTDHAGEAYGIMAYTPELATCQTATTYDPDDEFGPTYCNDEGRSGFEFPDSEPLVQFEFEKNLAFALSLAESAADPANPVSSLGLTAPDFQVDTFTESWGTSQEVSVWAKREFKLLRMNWKVNGGRTKSIAAHEWSGGERYGRDGRIWYSEYRATVPHVKPGDQVEVWFTAVDLPSKNGNKWFRWAKTDPFTYDVVNDGAQVLIVSDNSPGTPLGGTAPLDYLNYYTDTLDQLGASYDVFDVGAAGPAPHPLGVLSHYGAVIWYTGDKLVTNYQGGLDTTLISHEMNMVMRDFINEGGKIIATGADHGFQEFFPLNYGQNGAPDQVCVDNCLILTDDVYQYWFGGSTRIRRGGLDPDGNVLDVTGSGDEFAGYTFGLDGGDGAANQAGGTASWLVTSSILDENEFPQFASERLAGWAVSGGAPFEPVTGDWQVATDHDDVAYKRLATTVDLTGASSASLDFSTSYRTELDWDFMFVEVHRVGQDDWTTLPDANGHTSQSTGTPGNSSCESGWAAQLHPQMDYYQTLNPDGTCSPTGNGGEWHATSGASTGIEQWSIDLSKYAGSEIEVSISYATDWGTGDLGVFLDDASVTVDGNVVSDESFEIDLGDWTLIGAPPGSAANPNDWERVGVVYEVASVVGTEDTVLMGFGFEAIDTQEERNEVMLRALKYLFL